MRLTEEQAWKEALIIRDLGWRWADDRVPEHDEYKDFGLMNTWGGHNEVWDCLNKDGHDRHYEKKGRCIKTYWCNTCKIKWEVDSSD